RPRSPQRDARPGRATPKDTRSASESYSSPNSEVECVRRAIRPSRPSRTPAAMMSTAAISKFPWIEYQSERYPQNRLPTVKRVGRTKRPRESRSRESRATRRAPAPAGDSRHAGLQLLALADEQLAVVGKKDVDSRPELDDGDALPAGELLADGGVEHDPAGERARDLLERETALGSRQRHARLLVVGRGLIVESGELLSGDVNEVVDAPRGRRAVDVAVEDGHED